MFVKTLTQCNAFIANDGCLIQELIHPKNDLVELPYSIAMATVKAGKHSYKHTLEQEEVYLITKGQGKMVINDEDQNVSTGDAILIPANAIQWIENTGHEELQFFAIVSPPWTSEGDKRID